MPQTFAGDFWKEDRTDAFYPRAWHLGGSNSGYVMVPQSRYLLDMSYFRIKNIMVGYTLPSRLLRSVHLANARIYVSLENRSEEHTSELQSLMRISYAVF